MSPGLTPRPSLSAGDHDRGPRIHSEVSPGLTPRPSLSVGAGERTPWRHCVSPGLTPPAFVERAYLKNKTALAATGVAGANAPAFVERRSPLTTTTKTSGWCRRG